MISIIASSINTEQNILFRKNIEETIGVPYELIIHDNRETNGDYVKYIIIMHASANMIFSASSMKIYYFNQLIGENKSFNSL